MLRSSGCVADNPAGTLLVFGSMNQVRTLPMRRSVAGGVLGREAAKRTSLRKRSRPGLETVEPDGQPETAISIDGE